MPHSGEVLQPFPDDGTATERRSELTRLWQEHTLGTRRIPRYQLLSEWAYYAGQHTQ